MKLKRRLDVGVHIMITLRSSVTPGIMLIMTFDLAVLVLSGKGAIKI